MHTRTLFLISLYGNCESTVIQLINAMPSTKANSNLTLVIKKGSICLLLFSLKIYSFKNIYLLTTPLMDREPFCYTNKNTHPPSMGGTWGMGGTPHIQTKDKIRNL